MIGLPGSVGHEHSILPIPYADLIPFAKHLSNEILFSTNLLRFGVTKCCCLEFKKLQFSDEKDSKIIKSCEEDLAKITGQKPVILKFKKSISNFKTRKNTNAGLKVTLRKNKMYEFIDRLVNIALPRIKDFRGLSPNSFDKFGNYTFGIKEHIIFPEVNFDQVDKIRGLDITIVISSFSKEHSYELLNKLNFPFKKGDN